MFELMMGKKFLNGHTLLKLNVTTVKQSIPAKTPTLFAILKLVNLSKLVAAVLRTSQMV